MKQGFSATTAALVILAALLSGGTVWFLKDGAEPPPPPPAAPPPKAAAPAAVPEAPGAVERALRKRIRQLEAELAAARNPPAATNAPSRPEVHQMPKQGDFRPPNPREMMENLKKNDPKRYAEFQKRFQRMRQRQLERTKGRLDYFGSIDTSGMSEAEQANHAKLQELLAQRENLPDPGELSEEEMRASMQQRRELDRAIRAANATERTALLQQTASALGLEGDDAKVLTDTIQEVIRATESDHGGPHGPPPQGAPGR